MLNTLHATIDMYLTEKRVYLTEKRVYLRKLSTA